MTEHFKIFPDFYTWTYFITIFCIIHFAVFSVILFFKKGNNPANKVLALIVLNYAYAHFFHLLFLNKEVYQHYHIVNLGIFTVVISPPLLWIYVKLMVGEKIILIKKDFCHLLPLIPAAYHFLLFFIFSPVEINAYLDRTYTDINWQTNVVHLVGFLQVNYYCFVSIKILSKYKEEIHADKTGNKGSKIAWLRQIVILILIMHYVVLGYCLIEKDQETILSYFPYLTIGPYILLIYKSLNHPIIFNSIEKEHFSFGTPIDQTVGKSQNKEKVDQLTVEIYNKAVHFINEEKPYLNSEITIGEMANKINVQHHQLSFAINTVGQKNFFDFINSFRVEHAKKCFSDTSYSHLTLEAISEECGFGSKTAFNRAFKKNTGLIPSQYKKNFGKTTLSSVAPSLNSSN